MNPFHKLVVVSDQIDFFNAPKHLIDMIFPLFRLVFAVGVLELLEFILEAVNHDIFLVELEHQSLIVLSQLLVLLTGGGHLLVFLVDSILNLKIVMAQFLQFAWKFIYFWVAALKLVLQLLTSVLEGYFLGLCKMEWYVGLLDVILENVDVVLKFICLGFV